MRRAVLVGLAVFLLATVARAWSQPQQGFGPTFDATNQALRVNVVAGGASGGTSSNFGQAFPGTGTAAGAKDPNGAMASLTVSNTGRLQVTCDNCSSSAATFGTAFPSSGGAIGYKDALGAFASVTGSNGGLNVNVLSGGGGSSNFGTAFPSGGVPGGYKDTLGAFASFTGSNGKQNVIVGNESTISATLNASNAIIGNVRTTSDSTLTATVTQGTAANLNALVAQGASASVTNAWPWVTVTDAGVMVRPGDDTNKALRVNIVAGGTTGATFGTAFPSTGTAAGFKDGNGALASATVNNAGAQNVNVVAGSTISATVTQTTAANLNALVAQGASATTANAWPIVNVDDAGVMVRAGDATNKAMRVNIVAGGSTNSTFGTVFPTTGIAGGYKDANGGFASFTGSNGKQNVIVGNESNLSATLNASNAIIGNVRTTSDSTLTATVTQGTAANLNALVAQGASGSVTNAWPWVTVSDGGVMVRPGDDTNKAIRVNVVAGSGSGLSVQDSASWTAAVSNFVPNGGVFNDSAAPLTSGQQGTVRQTANRAQHQNLRDSSSQELGAKLPGAVNAPVQVNQQPQLQALAPPTLSQLTADARAVRSGVGSPAWGAGQMMAMVTDGTTSVKIARPNISSAATDPALVVTQSPMPSLQCPNTTAISQSASATLINGTTGKVTFICTLSVNARDTAVRISVIEGTGTNCGTGATALIGGTSASYGLSSTGGFHGVSDRVTIPGKVPGNNVCLIQDAAVNVSGVVTWGQY